MIETGTLKWFNRAKGYGFIDPDAPIPEHVKAVRDIMFHMNDMVDLNEMLKFSPGVAVRFERIEGRATKAHRVALV